MEHAMRTETLSAFKQNWTFVETNLWGPCSREWWVAPYTEASRALSGLVCTVAFSVLGIIASLCMLPVFPRFIRERSVRIVHDCFHLVPYVAFRILAGACGAIPIVGWLIMRNFGRVPEVPVPRAVPTSVAVEVQARVQTADAEMQTDGVVAGTAVPQPAPSPPPVLASVSSTEEESESTKTIQTTTLSNSPEVPKAIPPVVSPGNDLASSSGGSDTEVESTSPRRGRHHRRNEVVSTYNLRHPPQGITRSCSFCKGHLF